MASSDDEIVPAGQLTGPIDKKKAYGRTLRDVRGKLEFSAAERQLLKACAGGTAADIAETMPTALVKDNCVRPDLIRFLALGGDDSTPVHERGIAITGAWIDGSIDLQGCEVVCPIKIADCHIAGDLVLLDSTISSLDLGGSTVNRIAGDRLKCSGGISLSRNFHATGTIRLRHASIRGDLELMGATIKGDQKSDREGIIALLCDGIEIGGSVLAYEKGQSFSATGVVSFYGAKIGGNFSFLDATFNADKLSGLNCELAEIGGVFYFESVTLTGRTKLLEMQTRGDLQFFTCRFERGSRLVLTRAQVKGRLVFVEITGSTDEIVLRGARADALVDNIPSWSIAGRLVLDGFQYERILDTGYWRDGEEIHLVSPVDAKSRIAWLQMQHPLDLGKNFKPQPWEQLARVLAAMGHEDDARGVAIEKQKQKRSAWLIQSRANKDGVAKRLRLLWSIVPHWMYGALSRYGYRPSLLIAWAFLAALIFAGMFRFAELQGVMAPTDRPILANASHDPCRPDRWTKCRELLGKYPPFDPLIYSFDLILPVIATQHVREWAPQTTKADGRRWRLGIFIWTLSRMENLFGWVLGLMFVATVSGLIKKD